MSTPEVDIPMIRIPKSASPVPTTPLRSSKRVPPLAYAGGSLALAGLLLFGAQQMGWYGTSGRAAGETGGRVELQQGRAIGLDVKGWMSIQQVLEAFPVTRAALYAQFGIPGSTPTSTTLGELSEAGVSTLDIPTLRTWLDTLG